MGMGEYTVGIDPGLRELGASLFRGKDLIACALIRNPEKTRRGAEVWTTMADAVEEWLAGELPGIDAWPRVPPDLLVVERMQVYPRGGPDPDDLLELNGVVGAVAGRLGAKKTVSYTPRAWKGQTPKPIHNARVEMKLAPSELSLIKCPASLRHNVLDAIGIVMNHLGR